jgi:hypothetical protein
MMFFDFFLFTFLGWYCNLGELTLPSAPLPSAFCPLPLCPLPSASSSASVLTTYSNPLRVWRRPAVVLPLPAFDVRLWRTSQAQENDWKFGYQDAAAE